MLLEADDGSAVELVYGPDTRATKKRYGDRSSALLLANCRIFDEKSERRLDVWSAALISAAISAQY